MDAWRIYLDELRRRAGTTDGLFDRRERLAEAAHDAYQATADLMTREHGWADEHALVVMRGLNQAVQRWIQHEDGDWERLRAALQRTEEQLAERRSSPAPDVPPELTARGKGPAVPE